MSDTKNRFLVCCVAIALVGATAFPGFAAVSAPGKNSQPTPPAINGNANTKLPTLTSINAKGGGCKDNGHGNDPDHFDESNPGKSTGFKGNNNNNGNGHHGRNCGGSPPTDN